jgi:hypothetical protein
MYEKGISWARGINPIGRWKKEKPKTDGGKPPAVYRAL